VGTFLLLFWLSHLFLLGHIADNWMRPVAIDGRQTHRQTTLLRSSVVCLCVCLPVGHIRESCKNGGTDRDAFGGALSYVGLIEPCVKWDQYPHENGQFWGLQSNLLKSIGIRESLQRLLSFFNFDA